MIQEDTSPESSVECSSCWGGQEVLLKVNLDDQHPPEVVPVPTSYGSFTKLSTESFLRILKSSSEGI